MKMKKALIGALSASMLLSAAVSPVPFCEVPVADAMAEDQLLDYIDDKIKIEYTADRAGAVIRNVIFFETPTEYTIPETIDGHRVIELGETSLANEKGIDGLIVPKCVRYIRGGAFSGSDFKWIRFENPDIYIDDSQSTIGSTTKIIGYSGSDAEIYSYKHWRNFVAIDRQVTDGTVNGVIYNDGVAISGIVDPSAEEIVIPEEIDGLPVVSIWHGAFLDNLSLKSVVIPPSVRTIEFSAFTGCENLEKVTLTSGIEELGSYAFSECCSLKEIAIPDSLHHIGEFAFGSCTALENVVLPETIETIGANAFKDTPWLEEQVTDDGLNIVNGVLLDGHGFKGGELVIPDGVRVICGGAFGDMENITSVSVPEGVNYLGSSAFYGCKSLETAALPESLTEIGGNLFAECPALKSVSLGREVSSIESNAFNNCELLTEITLPDTVELIGFAAFSGCTSLEKVNIPGSVKSIKMSAFSGCTALTDIDFSQFESAEIDMNCFYKVPWLEAEKEKSEMVIVGKVVLDGTQCTGDVTIPDGIEAIAGYAFRESGITSVTFPETTRIFGFGAFTSCKELTEFTIPDGTKEITGGMFSSCTSLKKVNIPESVTIINNGAFNFCYSLTEFTVPANVSIVSGAFEYCDNLKKVTVENPDCIISGDSENFLAMPMNTTIRGYAGSPAYWFARSSGRNFEPIYTPGDINNDGGVTIADAVALQKWLKNDPEPLLNWLAADFDENGKVNVYDLILLKQTIAEN